jgi:hypothetical protein
MERFGLPFLLIDQIIKHGAGHKPEAHNKVAEASLRPIGMFQIRAQQGHDSSVVADGVESVEECFCPTRSIARSTPRPAVQSRVSSTKLLFL